MRIIWALLITVFALHASADVEGKIITDVGPISFRLYSSTPALTDNFVQLAKGTARYYDVNAQRGTKPFYNGLIFHRAHPELGIFSGCPWGTGRGWPGYFINDDYTEGSKFDRPGLMGMAKIPGDNKVGSQFFITTKASPHLDGRYSVFGEVISGMDVVQKIAKADRDVTMKPKRAIRIKQIEFKD